MSQMTPKINMFERIEPTKLNTSVVMPSMRMEGIEQPSTVDFKSVLSGLVENLNNQINAPDNVLNDALQGNADMHDVMTSILKADIQVNIATTAVTKVVTAYEKISQISI